jgi:hypothetical protein
MIKPIRNEDDYRDVLNSDGAKRNGSKRLKTESGMIGATVSNVLMAGK